MRRGSVVGLVAGVCLLMASAASAAGSGAPVNATEGAQFSGTVATFDHQVHAATIDWGDGASSAFLSPNGSSSVTGSHTYAEEGHYTVTVTETGCGQPPCDQASTTASVADASLSASGSSVSASAGHPFSGQVASFTDADPQGSPSDYSATIDWGDGSSSPGSVRAAAGGGFAVDGSHTYDSPGTDSIRVTINDAGGAAAGAGATATVSGFAVSAAKTVAGDYVRFDASTAPAASHAVSYSWDFAGTGTPQATCGSSTPVVYHSFPSGTHDVSLFVTDSSGATSRYDRTITVTGPAGSPARGRIRNDGFHLPAALLTAPLGGPSAAVTYTRSPSVAFCQQVGELPPPACQSYQNSVQFGLFDAVADPGWCEEQQTGARGVTHTVWKAKPGQVVRVNGLDLVPQPGVAIVLRPDRNQVTTQGGSGLVDVVLNAPPEFGGDIDLGTAPLNWRPGAGDTSYPLPDFPLPPDSLLGFALDGTASAKLVQNAAVVTVHLQLPSEFQLPGLVGTATSDVKIGADNADGVRLDGLDIEVPDLLLGALEVKHFGVIYQRDQDIWEGHGSVVLPSTGEIDAQPPAPYGFGLKDGRFDHAGAKLKFVPPLPVGGPVGVMLNQIGFGVGTHPTYFRGDVELSWFDLVRLNGSLLLAFPTAGEPFVLKTGSGAAIFTVPSLLTSGDLSLSTPFGDVPIASAYLNWIYPDYVEFGGGLHYQFFPHFNVISIDANFHANAELHDAKFDIEGSASVCVIDGTICGGGDFVLSSHGVGGCFRSWLDDFGADYEYGGSLHVMFHSCDASAAREVVPFPHADIAAGDRLVRIGRGLRGAIIGVKGQGGAPYVTLTGPHGETVSTPYPSGAINDHHYLVARSTSTNETFLVIGHPAPGLWKITPMTGSVPIASVEQGYTLAPPVVHARVAGRGRAFALRYAIRPIEGQTVQFAEHGAHEYHLLGQARGSRGTLRFSPGAGPGGWRTIQAKVFSYGTLRKIVNVARYRAPAPPAPPTPSGVRATRSGQTLVISWGRTPGARRFGVGAILSDGRHLGFILTSGRRSVRIPGFGRTDSAIVRVMVLSGDNHPGRQVKVRVGPQRRRARRRGHH